MLDHQYSDDFSTAGKSSGLITLHFLVSWELHFCLSSKEKKIEVGEGTTVYSCYKLSVKMSYLT